MGMACFAAIFIWAYFSIAYQKRKSIDDITGIAHRISETIRLGTHYAMKLNARDDINQIIQNTANQKGIVTVRITNKEGFIKFSNFPDEVDRDRQQLDSEACLLCHRQDPPLVKVTLDQRRRLFASPGNEQLMGIITPIYNEPGCSASCHFHDPDKAVLGALDVVLSLEEIDAEILKYEKSIFLLAMVIVVIPSLFIIIFVYQVVIKPVRQLTENTTHIAADREFHEIEADPHSEIGQLASAFTAMEQRIRDNQMELTNQKNEYQTLFENVPCLITVQDRHFQLVNYNREFYEKYNPGPGDYCYQAYKRKGGKCAECPVEKTFEDGQSHYSEQQGIGKDGSMEYWIARTSPIRDADGEVVAAMEISLDISDRKRLEQRAEQSERKYQVIFDSIPTPVFVLDYDTLTILNCNSSVFQVYGYQVNDLRGKKFTHLFADAEGDEQCDKIIRDARTLEKVRHRIADGGFIFVDIWISPSEYPGQKVLLVTTSDITERLETENQFNQAAKLATLGEMATGVAHELNQPLSVIKTASSFCISKINKDQEIKREILHKLLIKIDTNVDRASKIIVHMRDFARKSDIEVERVSIQEIVHNALEIFSQQLKVRGIEVICDIPEKLPHAMADPGRLEQVFINLLLNARDAIEEKFYNPDDGAGGPVSPQLKSVVGANGEKENEEEAVGHNSADSQRHGVLGAANDAPSGAKSGASYQREKRIVIRGRVQEAKIVLEVEDSGAGIPEAVASKIFQPFFTTKEVGKGTGLGLSITYGIVKECKGVIRLKKSSGNGSTFQILLPPAGEEEKEKRS